MIRYHRSRVALVAPLLLAAAPLLCWSPLLQPVHAQDGEKRKEPREGEGKKKDNTPSTPEQKLLRRMMDAERKRAYIAREASFRADGPGTEQWVKHDPRRGLRRESIQPPGALLIDDFRRSWRIARAGAPAIEGESIRKRFSGKRMAGFLDRNRRGGLLRIEIVGEDRVAGRLADIVRVAGPRGAEGPHRRFWIDRETGLRLRTEEVGPDGKVLSGSYFLSLDLNPTFGKNDFSPPPGRIILDLHRRYSSFEEAAKAGFRPRKPGYLPSGFALRQVDAIKDGKQITQRYANGLNVFSLVESKEGIPPFLRRNLGPEGSGFVSLPREQRGYIWTQGDMTFVLIGSLADDEFKRIADSVR